VAVGIVQSRDCYESLSVHDHCGAVFDSEVGADRGDRLAFDQDVGTGKVA
jgi:hypothetical protein